MLRLEISGRQKKSLENMSNVMQRSVEFLLCEDDVALQNDTAFQQTLKQEHMSSSFHNAGCGTGI